ncbi:ankyrin repeat domain-containing protein [Natronospora cellulosivora (SeqCode)]
MSEFTECYHLRTDNQKDAAVLLKRSGLNGYVFPPANNWVTLVSEKYEFSENPDLIHNNKGLLLHFAYAKDHGWFFTIYEGSKEICHYHYIWETGDEDGSRLNEKIIYDLIQEEELKKFDIERPDIKTIIEDPQGFAEIIGLTNYEWISYHYIDEDYEPSNELYQEFIKVKVKQGNDYDFIYHNYKKKNYFDDAYWVEKLKEGADPYKLLESAVIKNDYNAVKVLLKNGVNPVNYIDESGYSVLHLAADRDIASFESKIRYGQVEIIADKLNLDLENGDREENENLLLAKMIEDNIDIIKILLDSGMDINIRSKLIENNHIPSSQGITPLMLAAHSSIIEKLKFLLKAGAELNVAEDNTDDLLFWALRAPLTDRKRKIESIKYLIEEGVDVNVKNQEGESAIFYAASKELLLEVIEPLLDRGADISEKEIEKLYQLCRNQYISSKMTEESRYREMYIERANAYKNILKVIVDKKNLNKRWDNKLKKLGVVKGSEPWIEYWRGIEEREIIRLKNIHNYESIDPYAIDYHMKKKDFLYISKNIIQTVKFLIMSNIIKEAEELISIGQKYIKKAIESEDRGIGMASKYCPERAKIVSKRLFYEFEFFSTGKEDLVLLKEIQMLEQQMVEEDKAKKRYIYLTEGRKNLIYDSLKIGDFKTARKYAWEWAKKKPGSNRIKSTLDVIYDEKYFMILITGYLANPEKNKDLYPIIKACYDKFYQELFYNIMKIHEGYRSIFDIIEFSNIKYRYFSEEDIKLDPIEIIQSIRYGYRLKLKK